MRAYIITTAAVFALILVAHIARAIAEGPHVIMDPAFLVLTAAALALCVWAVRLLWRAPRT